MLRKVTRNLVFSRNYTIPKPKDKVNYILWREAKFPKGPNTIRTDWQSLATYALRKLLTTLLARIIVFTNSPVGYLFCLSLGMDMSIGRVGHNFFPNLLSVCLWQYWTTLGDLRLLSGLCSRVTNDLRKWAIVCTPDKRQWQVVSWPPVDW